MNRMFGKKQKAVLRQSSQAPPGAVGRQSSIAGKSQLSKVVPVEVNQQGNVVDGRRGRGGRGGRDRGGDNAFGGAQRDNFFRSEPAVYNQELVVERKNAGDWSDNSFFLLSIFGCFVVLLVLFVLHFLFNAFGLAPEEPTEDGPPPPKTREYYETPVGYTIKVRGMIYDRFKPDFNWKQCEPWPNLDAKRTIRFCTPGPVEFRECGRNIDLIGVRYEYLGASMCVTEFKHLQADGSQGKMTYMLNSSSRNGTWNFERAGEWTNFAVPSICDINDLRRLADKTAAEMMAGSSSEVQYGTDGYGQLVTGKPRSLQANPAYYVEKVWLRNCTVGIVTVDQEHRQVTYGHAPNIPRKLSEMESESELEDLDAEDAIEGGAGRDEELPLET